jgi:hypothetical protein
VFCTRDRGSILLPNDPAAHINTGSFQLPLYAGRVPSETPFCEGVLARGMPRLPCASLLVRVLAAPKSQDGLAVLSCADSPEGSWAALGVRVPAPDYSSGRYDGSLCEPGADELLSFSAKLGERPGGQGPGGGVGGGGMGGTVKGFLQRVLSTHTGHALPPPPEGYARHTLHTTHTATLHTLHTHHTLQIQHIQCNAMQCIPNRAVSNIAYLHPLYHISPLPPSLSPPPRPGVTGAESQQWADGLLPPPASVSAVLDYSFAAPYSFEAGLDVNVVQLFNVPDSGMFSSKTMLFKVSQSVS